MLYAATAEASGPYYIPHLYRLESGDSDFTEMTLPNNTVASSLRPCFFTYRRRIYAVGMFVPGIVITENQTIHWMGIRPPMNAPTIAASGTGLTGTYIGYLTFAQKDPAGKYVIHESNLSAASGTLTAANQGIAWSGIPTVATDQRVTHVRGWRSIGGEPPRLVWERALGSTSTVTESVPDSIVSNQTITPVDSDGVTVTHGRGVPPKARIAVMWRDRAWYVGDPSDTIYYSELFEPESVRVDPDQKGAYTNTLRTKGGESIIGIKAFEDALLLYCNRAIYALTGYSTASFEMRKITDSFDLTSHHGIVSVGGVHIFPSTQGISVCTGPGEGAFRNLMARSYADQWLTDYAAEPLPFEVSQGMYDRKGGNYILLTAPATAPKTHSYVGYFKAMTEEGSLEPSWSRDKQTRKTTCIGEYSASGSKLPTVIYGASDGYIRKEDTAENDDDSDSFLKAMTIQHKHFFFGDQGGDLNHGRKYDRVDVFAKNENTALTVNGYSGDESAPDATTPRVSKTIAASASSGYVAKTSHEVLTPRLAGKGVTIEITASSPVGVEYRGMKIYHEDGPQQRPSSS